MLRTSQGQQGQLSGPADELLNAQHARNDQRDPGTDEGLKGKFQALWPLQLVQLGDVETCCAPLKASRGKFLGWPMSCWMPSTRATTSMMIAQTPPRTRITSMKGAVCPISLMHRAFTLKMIAEQRVAPTPLCHTSLHMDSTCLRVMHSCVAVLVGAILAVCVSLSNLHSLLCSLVLLQDCYPDLCRARSGFNRMCGSAARTSSLRPVVDGNSSASSSSVCAAGSSSRVTAPLRAFMTE